MLEVVNKDPLTMLTNFVRLNVLCDHVQLRFFYADYIAKMFRIYFINFFLKAKYEIMKRKFPTGKFLFMML